MMPRPRARHDCGEEGTRLRPRALHLAGHPTPSPCQHPKFIVDCWCARAGSHQKKEIRPSFMIRQGRTHTSSATNPTDLRDAAIHTCRLYHASRRSSSSISGESSRLSSSISRVSELSVCSPADTCWPRWPIPPHYSPFILPNQHRCPGPTFARRSHSSSTSLKRKKKQ